jgi:sugar phosphate isomerase/epimerase
LNFDLFGLDTATLAGPLEARLAAARRAGFAHVMISATDVANHPGGVDAAVGCIRESGLRVTGLAALRDFEGLAGKMHEYKVDVAKSMLELCSRIGGRILVTHASTSAHAEPDLEHAARDLAKLAFLAMPLGIRIALKGFPWSRTVRSFSDATEILAIANCRNLGLAIDSFDIITAGIPPAELDLVPREQVFLAQLSDFVLHEVRKRGEREATAHHFRVFPGEGAHGDAIVALIRALEENGYLGDYSFDVYNSDYLEMPAALIAQRGRMAADWLGEMVLRRTLVVPNVKRLRETRAP